MQYLDLQVNEDAVFLFLLKSHTVPRVGEVIRRGFGPVPTSANYEVIGITYVYPPQGGTEVIDVAASSALVGVLVNVKTMSVTKEATPWWKFW